MNRHKYIAWPTYLVAFLLIAFPLSETLLSVWPLQPGTTNWRFGAGGLLSRALMTPLLGVLMMFVVAVLAEHRIFVRVLSLLMGVLAVGLMAISALFVLDALQMRAQVNPEMKTAFDIAALMALGKYGLTVVVSFVFLFAGLRSLRGGARPGRAAKGAERPAATAPVPVEAPVVPGTLGSRIIR